MKLTKNQKLSERNFKLKKYILKIVLKTPGHFKPKLFL